ncbi:MAG TPA: hypothetical protein VLA62_01315 [Solirubrobacterales bacterium]|nr:hypothetical protein [Solirubrobacterales bacterium]
MASVLFATLSGCAGVPAPTVVSVEDATTLAGPWQGWLVTERGFVLVTFDIRADGTFEVSAPSIRATGLLVVSESRLRFDGTGPWRGTLMPEGQGERRTLRIERDDRLYRGTLHPAARRTMSGPRTSEARP